MRTANDIHDTNLNPDFADDFCIIFCSSTLLVPWWARRPPTACCSRADWGSRPLEPAASSRCRRQLHEAKSTSTCKWGKTVPSPRPLQLRHAQDFGCFVRATPALGTETKLAVSWRLCRHAGVPQRFFSVPVLPVDAPSRARSVPPNS